ncbi:GlxA family transcriptional regulator [Pseudohalocynthiibacter aestuariivivens]|uniref:GlxA family transcriptional regulator n=2 Tax=Pseudohalocynthiibacter aestuariivivens TaxID=1591409 RepID=A0ABV5JEA6_9RHOB
MFHFADPNGYVAVVLMEGFSTLSLGAIVEPFSYLSQTHPEIAPKLTLVGLRGQQVQSQSGVMVNCDEESEALIERLKHGRAPVRVIVCGPAHAGPFYDRCLSSLLRVAIRYGASICTLGAATWQMAETGLLKTRATTVHWSSFAAFSERYSDVDTRETLYVPSEMIASCAGETAALDMALDLIASISPTAAEQTANHLLVAFPRVGKTSQPGARGNRLRGVPSLLADAVRLMVNHIEDPLNTAAISAHCGVSVRQLERLFQRHLCASPMQYYTQLRVQHAHDLVLQTDMSLLDVAVASGFSSTGLLSKKFKKNFGLTPSQMRNRAQVGATV